MKRAIIADKEPYVSRLTAALRNNGFEVVAATEDGAQALQLILELVPDLVVMDLLLPYMDGLTLIQTLRQQGMGQIRIFISTFVNSSEIIQQLNYQGISGFFVKPYDASQVALRILNALTFSRETVGLSMDRERSVQLHITQALKRMGAPMQIKGYPMLIEAIYQVVMDPERIHAMISVLYPEVGRRCNATASQVERNLRHLIERIWDRCRVDIMEEYFGNSLDMNRDKPNNSEFIATIAEHIRNQLY